MFTFAQNRCSRWPEYATNAGFLEAKATDGLRRCLAEEFSELYVFHLRGLRGQKTAGDRAKREGGQIFGAASGAAICIFVLVKNPSAAGRGRIYYRDIGDYLSREQKLEKITGYASIAGISAAEGWQAITPDLHGDWLKQRDDNFSSFMPMGDKRSDGYSLFENFSLGVVTNRDAWCYNPSNEIVSDSMTKMIRFFNVQAEKFNKIYGALPRKERDTKVDSFIDTDPTKISWTRALKQALAKNMRFEFEPSCMVQGLYRPFTKQWLYFNHRFNEMVYQMPRIFPDATVENIVIGVSASDSRSAYSVHITNLVASLHAVDMVGSQYFPLYLYDDAEGELSGESAQVGLFPGSADETATIHRRRYALTSEGLTKFRSAYPGETLDEEDLFYYIYGLLHSPDYRSRYSDNLGKELPRIPRVGTAAAFWAFSKGGRALADLHLHYESVPMYSGARIEHGGKPLTDADYRVEKMRHGKKGKEKDLSTVIYNQRITATGIPLEAYEYVVNGKSAIEWVMERQCVKTDKASGIVSDANDWAIETMQNPRYPLELLLRVISVSLETMKIVKALPSLELQESTEGSAQEATAAEVFAS